MTELLFFVLGMLAGGCYVIWRVRRKFRYWEHKFNGLTEKSNKH